MLDKVTKETERRPYGVCVWSTGVAPLPITTTIIQRVTGQNKGSVSACTHILHGGGGTFVIEQTLKIECTFNCDFSFVSTYCEQFRKSIKKLAFIHAQCLCLALSLLLTTPPYSCVYISNSSPSLPLCVDVPC